MRTRGFTLIELMVSLALMAVLATLCATVAASAREDDRVARGYAEVTCARPPTSSPRRSARRTTSPATPTHSSSTGGGGALPRACFSATALSQCAGSRRSTPP